MPAPVAAQLPPRNPTWGRDVIVLAAIGLALLGLAPMRGHPGWAIPGLTGCIPPAIARCVLGRRPSMRADLPNRPVQALPPSLDHRAPDRPLFQMPHLQQERPEAPRNA